MTHSLFLIRPCASTHSPGARRGVTLMEVLISMGILLVGLLGAAALFPVGSYFMQKGDIADRGSAIAKAAFADLVTRGIDPDEWQVWDTDTGSYRPMAQSMRAWMTGYKLSAPAGASLADFQTQLNQEKGFSYLIDPIGIAQGTRAGLNPQALSRAPYNAQVIWPAGQPELTGTFSAQTEWVNSSWALFGNSLPVRRLTTASASMGQLPSPLLAERRFESSDDLSYTTQEGDLPTHQRVTGFDDNGDLRPEVGWSRNSGGNFSWLVSISPSQSKAREALANDPTAYYYDVTVVVFYKRDARSIDQTERMVFGEVIATGTGGGEILLTQLVDGIEASPYDELKQGQWVMVCGPHPSATPEEPLFFTQWYRVLAIDEEEKGYLRDEDSQRLVGLRGPDWPWAPGAQVRVGLFPGAVAVHTKSLRFKTLGAYAVDGT